MHELQSEIRNTNSSPLVCLGCIGKTGKEKSVKPQHQLDLTIGVIGAGSFNKLRKVSKSAKKCAFLRTFSS